MERMEGVIGNIVSKIDKVLIKLESMEKTKSKKKSKMSSQKSMYNWRKPRRRTG